MTDTQAYKSFERYRYAGLAVDPIHVGTGGARLGRVDNTIVRDPATKLPKIPGSSLAGVLRTYVAMAEELGRNANARAEPYYPDCAGQGQRRADGSGGHCGQRTCKVCTVFGFARGKDSAGGFAGLAAFSDMHLLLFPVPTREGPVWVTSPGALRVAGIDQKIDDENKVYRKNGQGRSLNLGWLLLDEAKLTANDLFGRLEGLGIPKYIRDRIALVSDKLFSHVVNSNLEVRTSVAIDASTGAAEEGALFTYEALPRASVLCWDVICRFPGHFRIGSGQVEAVKSPEDVHDVVKRGYPYLEALGIGGMGTRGMGRLKVLHASSGAAAETQAQASGRA
ncbi:MAG: type III-B CRISPR module RAMP protein Cmr4 [Acidimicrobiia bacterium]|nr:MAG: type III-B CRISPR module RAMP protein Cmr4 [Acidimicrobiia bacterium]